MDARVVILEVKAEGQKVELHEMLSALTTYLRSIELRHHRICLALDGFYSEVIPETLISTYPAIQFLTIDAVKYAARLDRGSGPEMTAADKAFDFVVALCHPSRFFGMARHVSHCFVDSPPILMPIPTSGDGSLPRSQNMLVSLGSEKPLVVLLFPGAGTARLSPVLRQLMNHYQRNFYWLPTLAFSRFFIHTHLGLRTGDCTLLFGENVIQQDAIDRHYHAVVTAFHDYYMWTTIHIPVSTPVLGSLHDMRVVYLYRDPRDVVNSMYHRLVYDGIEDDFRELRDMGQERAFLALFSGMDYVNSRRNYFLRWPSLQEMCNDFVAIQDYSNIYGLKYEDIRYRPHEAYRSLLNWLELTSTSLIPDLTDALLEKAIYAGTFEAQSGGKVREGEGDGKRTFRTTSEGAPTSLRRGVPGDWKNNFSPKVRQAAKEMAGEALIALGYEKDYDW